MIPNPAILEASATHLRSALTLMAKPALTCTDVIEIQGRIAQGQAKLIELETVMSAALEKRRALGSVPNGNGETNGH